MKQLFLILVSFLLSLPLLAQGQDDTQNPVSGTIPGMAHDYILGEYYWATFSHLSKNAFFPSSNVSAVYTIGLSDQSVNADLVLIRLSQTSIIINSVATSGYFVPQNTGVLIKAATPQVNYYLITENLNVALPEQNYLHAATGNTVGSENDGYKYYKLAYGNMGGADGESEPYYYNLGFYYGDSDNLSSGTGDGGTYTPSLGKAYLQLPDSLSSSSTPGLAPDCFIMADFSEETTTTEIPSVISQDGAVKVFREGIVYIIRNGIMYDVTGRSIKQ